MRLNDTHFDPFRNVQRARYKLQLSRTLANEAMQEARAIAAGAERNAWLRIARTSRQDAKQWLRTLREAAKAVQLAEV